MEESRVLTKKGMFEGRDCSFAFCGYSETQPLHRYGPAVRTEYVIHIVLDGRGTYQVGEQIYQLGKGQGFVIPPGEAVLYQADEEKPWTYVWLGVEGEMVEGYLAAAGLRPGFWSFEVQDPQDFQALIFASLSYQADTMRNELALQAQTFRFLELLLAQSRAYAQETTRQQIPTVIQKSLNIIHHRASENLSVAWLANELAVNPSHLSRLFRKNMGVTIKEYINQVRLHLAADQLRGTELSIEEIASKTGFSGSPSFSKAFKQVWGLSPSAFRLQKNYQVANSSQK